MVRVLSAPRTTTKFAGGAGVVDVKAMLTAFVNAFRNTTGQPAAVVTLFGAIPVVST